MTLPALWKHVKLQSCEQKDILEEYEHWAEQLSIALSIGDKETALQIQEVLDYLRTLMS